MRVAIADVGRRARMELRFAAQGGRTVLRNVFYEVPFKVTRLLSSSGPVAHLMLMHSTAGVFGGDELDCSIRVESGARAVITQQSATKVHPSRDRAAIQRTRVFVEDGADLELYLEPLIPFAGSRLRQTTELNVDRGGRLRFWEGFMTGRIGRGEAWQFEELGSETRLRHDGRLAFLDRFLLHRGDAQRMQAGCGYIGTGLHAGEDAGTSALELHRVLPDAGVDSLSPELSIVRVAAASGPEFHRAREAFAAGATKLVSHCNPLD